MRKIWNLALYSFSYCYSKRFSRYASIFVPTQSRSSLEHFVWHVCWNKRPLPLVMGEEKFGHQGQVHTSLMPCTGVWWHVSAGRMCSGCESEWQFFVFAKNEVLSDRDDTVNRCYVSLLMQTPFEELFSDARWCLWGDICHVLWSKG